MDFNIAVYLLGGMANLLEQAEKLTSHFVPLWRPLLCIDCPGEAQGCSASQLAIPAVPTGAPPPELALQHLEGTLRRLWELDPAQLSSPSTDAVCLQHSQKTRTVI